MRKFNRLVALTVTVLLAFGMAACHPEIAPSSSDTENGSSDSEVISSATEASKSNQSDTVSSLSAVSSLPDKQSSSASKSPSKENAKPISSTANVSDNTTEEFPEEDRPINTGVPSEAAIRKLEALFDGKMTEERDLFRSSSISGMHFTDSVWVDGVCYTYYISYTDSSGMGISMVKSDNGIDFHSPVRVLSPSESYDLNYASFPGIWYLDGVFYLVYECSAPAQHIALATSTDGVNFTKHGIILKTDHSLPWQNYNIGTPDLYWEDGVWYLTFHGFGSDQRDCQIGIAYGEDLFNLTMIPTPIIPTSKDPNAPDSGTTGRRDVIKAGDWYYMVYEISTDIGKNGTFEGSVWGHSFARSRNMLDWEVIQNYTPITTLGGMGCDGPSWMIADGDIWVHVRFSTNTYAYSFVEKE